MTPDDLRAWQKAMAITQTQAAQRLGISRSTYCSYLDQSRPAPRAIALACSALIAGLEPWPRQQKQT